MTATINTRKAELFAKASTATLVQSALILDAKGASITAEERMTRAWICDEIETRMGGVKDDAAFDALLDTDLTYTECLLVAFPELVA